MNVPYIVTRETFNRNVRGREIGVTLSEEDDNFVATVLTAVIPGESLSFPVTSAVRWHTSCEQPRLDGQWPWGSGARYVVLQILLCYQHGEQPAVVCTASKLTASVRIHCCLFFFKMSISFWQLLRAGLIRRLSDKHAGAARVAFPFLSAANYRTGSGYAKANG